MGEHDFERIQPADLEISSSATSHLPQAREAKPIAAGTVLLLASLVLLAAGVIFLLPDLIGEVEPPPPATVTEGAPASPAPAAAPRGTAGEAAPWQQAQTERERAAAKEVLDALLAVQFELQERGVEKWGAEEFGAAGALAREGDDHYKVGRYGEATARYRGAEQTLRALLEGIDARLAARLDAGEAAFAAGDQPAATRAFSEALAIDPANTRAAAALERAGKLGELQRLLAAGKEAEHAGDEAAARTRYREALALDAQWEPATQALAALEQRGAAAARSARVSTGFAALAAGRAEDARREFQAAIKLGAGPEARDGLQQAEFQLSQRRLAGLLERATAAEQAEDWARAQAEYDAALKVDATLQTAHSGKERAATRLALDKALETLAREPERLASDTGRTAASRLIDTASRISAPGPRLEAQLASARRLLAEMQTEVPVLLRSDGKTEVTVFRVGALGSFGEHSLSLLPGNYVAVGRRDGYRDVRVEFSVRAGIAPVTVQCQQRI